MLAQFPEFVGLMKSSLTEYKGMLDTIVSSDDASIKEYYGVANKEMDQAADSRKQLYAFVKQVQADCSKLLDNPNLPPEMMIEILNREAELVKMANEKDTEIRQQEKEIEDKVNKKTLKHKRDGKNGWYRYDSRFALPVYGDDGEVERYNVFHASMLIRHSNDEKMYLYMI